MQMSPLHISLYKKNKHLKIVGEKLTRSALNVLGKPRRLVSVNVTQADMFYQSSSALFSSISSFRSR